MHAQAVRGGARLGREHGKARTRGAVEENVVEAGAQPAGALQGCLGRRSVAVGLTAQERDAVSLKQTGVTRPDGEMVKGPQIVVPHGLVPTHPRVAEVKCRVARKEGGKQ